MTTATTARPAVAVPSMVARARDALASEWIKIRATRSTYWTLLIAILTGIALSAVIAYAFARTPSTAAGPPTDPLLPGVLSLEYALLAVGVLGVLTVTAEHATGLIRTTYTATPRRRTVLAAKAAVIAAVTLTVGETIAFVSFLIDQPILSTHHLGVSLTQPGVAGAVAAGGILLCVCALLGVGFGAIIRHTAGAITALITVILVPAAVGLLPAPWNNRIGRYTLIDAAQQVAAHHPRAGLLAPGLSLLVLIAWPAVVLATAALLTTRQDT
jgi:ABC-2 type transport system permease protein